MKVRSNKKAMKNMSYLSDHVKTKINLLEFLENKIGCDLKQDSDEHASCICPMPFHKDSAPSFHVRKNDDNVWVYHCFGCGSKGTILDFFMDYYEDCDNFMEALEMICEEFNIENTNDLALAAMKNITKTMDTNRKLENAHILTCNILRTVLQKDIEDKAWVLEQFDYLNKALDEEDILMVEEIGSQASRRLREKK